MAYSRSVVLVALLVALIALLCTPQPAEARFFRRFPRFRCYGYTERFQFRRAALLGDGEEFCFGVLNGTEYTISRPGASRCRVGCREVPSTRVSIPECEGLAVTFRAFGKGDSCEFLEG